ncbi:DNA-binding transcriptional regulator, AcrR family [Nonlabens sp. Hel1_33_55]|uniref:TetR family transcriptional regulator C-terminal domain-containing protein n=1 Tax=Nonlabens sp. Hel1_33_55 TaxID=1336802 RepID=UPI000875E2E4|nr:TetR family transcriptional regulator C-terminal domain-containing protein [Nonlabens sp. Hel1_33_55]SCY38305.1 DNA-binding transcriptional regulator, AcrR family [Nonlabens sp. Hel1_33_55]
MATVKKTAAKKTAKKKEINRQDVITAYMEYVLEHERTPKSVFKFAKENNMTEQEFYGFFGSFEGLRKEIWNTFFTMTMDVAHKSEDYHSFSNREKMLTFFYTFFELLTLNRSYVLFALQENQHMMSKMEQLKGLRKHVKSFAKELIQDRNENKSNILLERSETVYSEGAWVQMLFLLKFWMDDDSAGFEKTDMAIEKSVNTIFDVFDNTPLDAVFDFGKFLWKEKMA